MRARFIKNKRGSVDQTIDNYRVGELFLYSLRNI